MSEENKTTASPAVAETAASSSTADIEGEVKDLEITPNGSGASAKKDPNSKLGSNYYFFKSTPKEEQHKYAPQPITTPSPSPPPDLARQGSAWNAAGTWEDRDMSSWAHERLKSLFGDFELVLGDDCKARITTVSKVDGDASIVYTRGKRKIGYELSFTADFSGEHKETAVSGTIECPSIDYGDNEFQVIVKASKSDAAHDAVRNALNRKKSLIYKRFETFLKELNEA